MQKPTSGSHWDEPRPVGAIDPKRPLGADLLEHTSPAHLADRAKAVAVLRRAAELVQFSSHIETEHGLQEVMRRAALDVGVKPEEYREIVRRDSDLQELESGFLDTVRAAFPR
jgi:hypothetical protein